MPDEQVNTVHPRDGNQLAQCDEQQRERRRIRVKELEKVKAGVGAEEEADQERHCAKQHGPCCLLPPRVRNKFNTEIIHDCNDGLNRPKLRI